MMINCRICSNQISGILFSAEIFGCEVFYFDCVECGYVQTQEPTWLDEAYRFAINSSDTGILARNIANVHLVLATLALMRMRSASIVDYAGGYGFLVRLLRDVGIDATWADAYCENLVAQGFEYSGKGGVGLVTAFELFEHFVDPTSEMRKIVNISPNILLTTNLISASPPPPSVWWYYGLEHGQHIGFFRIKTLEFLAGRFGLNLMSDGVSTHLFSQKKYSYAAWRLLRSVARHMPNLLTYGLESKTWSDHLSVSKGSAN